MYNNISLDVNHDDAVASQSTQSTEQKSEDLEEGLEFVSDYLPGQENLYGNTAVNLTHTAWNWACGQGDWIYYAKDTIPDDNVLGRPTLMKFNIKTGDMMLVLEANSVHDIQVMGDWIFFTDGGEDAFYRVRTDGQEYAPVAGHLASNCLVFNNNLYYAQLRDVSAAKKKIELYSSTLDGREKRIIQSDVGTGEDNLYIKLMGIEEGQLYLAYAPQTDQYGSTLYANATVVKCDINTGKTTTIMDEDSSWIEGYSMSLRNAFIQDGQMWQFSGYRFGFDGTRHAPLQDATHDFQTLENNFINPCGSIMVSSARDTVIGVTSDYGIVWKSSQGSGQITTDVGQAICVIGDWVCYLYDNRPYCIKVDGTGWTKL